jgi:hypothetical protein
LCIDYLGGESGSDAGRRGWRRGQLLERYGFHTVCACNGCKA